MLVDFQQTIQQYSPEDIFRLLTLYIQRGQQHFTVGRIIYCDEIFKTVPRIFFQLYMVHGAHGGIVCCGIMLQAGRSPV
jgi:hypothetical protein